MIRNYLTVAFRTLLRNKFHSAINITGLAIGISACLIIYLIVNFELSFNKGIADYDRIYRIHSKFTGTFSGLNRGAPTAIAPYIRNNFSGVEQVALFFCFGSKVEIPTTTKSKKLEKQEAVAITGSDYFQVINAYHWIIGSPDVLQKPYQTVLTQSQARKYFGDLELTHILGKEVIYRDSLVTYVAGIVSDLPFNTDFSFTDFISAPTIEASWLKKKYDLENWTSTNSSTQVFVKTTAGATHQTLLDQLPQLTKIYDEKSSWDATNTFNVQPLSDLHFNSETGIFDFSRNATHLPTMITLIFVAILLLVIAAINFINLETAQAIRRAKEVGVRKVLGSSQGRLIIQFLSEGLLLTLIAIVVALPLTEVGLNSFKEFVPEGVTLNLKDVLPFLLLAVIFIGLLASAYPAFVLSSFKPALVLKNQTSSSDPRSRSAFLRKTLIVFQFSFAQVLIIGTLVVGWQIRYMLNKDLGFKKDAVIYFNTPWWEDASKTQVFTNEIASISEISELSMSNDPPSSNGWSSQSVKLNNGKEEISVNAFRKFGDSNYLNFYGIELIAGRNLQPSDTVKEYLINETLMKAFGFAKPEDALGKLIAQGERKFPIVGVVKDFHTKSLHDAIDPVMMANEIKDFTCFNIRLTAAQQTGDQLKAGLDKIETAWKKVYPDVPFEHHFLDETIKNFYQTEQRTAKLANTAMGLAIFISCLGLFGLASFTATQRTKEIGIRKVLGASVQQIVMLLSRDFILLVILAFVISLPIAWFAANEWLNGFSYRTTINAWMFGLTVLTAILVAFITVSFQTVRAANANPVESLRNE
jgi:ABC-type antimicrobial peptide transport system permease subunit